MNFNMIVYEIWYALQYVIYNNNNNNNNDNNNICNYVLAVVVAAVVVVVVGSRMAHNERENIKGKQIKLVFG